MRTDPILPPLVISLMGVFALMALLPAGHATNVYNVSDSSPLNSTADWSTSSGGSPGATPPSYLDTATWDGNSGSGSVALGANTSWYGLSYAPAAATTITSDGNTLTLGVGGIDMSAAGQDFTLNCNLTIGNGGQSWNVASGRTLTLGDTINRATGAGTVDFPGLGTVTGSGISGLTLQNDILPWATVAGSDWATVSGGNIAAYSGYDTSMPLTGGSSVVNYSYNTAKTLSGNLSANSIKVTAGALAVGTKTLNITSGGGLLIGTGGSVTTSSGGYRVTVGASGELIINVASGATLSTTGLRDDSVQASTLVKTGGGIWDGNNVGAMTGVSGPGTTVHVAQGELGVGNAAPFQCANLTVDSGAKVGVTSIPSIGSSPTYGGNASFPLAIYGNGQIGGNGGNSGATFGGSCTIYPGINGGYGTINLGVAAAVGSARATFGTGCSFSFDLSSSASGVNDKIVCVGNGSGSGTGPFVIANSAALNFAINPMNGTLAVGTYDLIGGSSGTPSVGTGITYAITFPNGGDPGTGNRSIAYNSAAKQIQLTVTSVSAMPTITSLTGPTVPTGSTSGNLSYSGTTGNPTYYAINWSAAAITAGFVNVSSTANLFNSGNGTIALTLPGSAAAGTYTGYLITSVGPVGSGNPSSYQQAFTVTVISGAPMTTTVSVSSSANPSIYLNPVNFPAAVQTNGATAGDATGTIQFLTNNVLFDTETVVSGGASSIGLSTLPIGTNVVTAIYSGDANYLSSTNSLNQVVTSGNAPVLTNSVSGHTLTLSWDSATHPGYTLEESTSLVGGWTPVTSTSPALITIDPTAKSVFYRLSHP